MSWYKAGTITVTNNSAVVAGAGTAFVDNVLAGDALIGPDGLSYEIVSVDSQTQMTIAPRYRGATAAAQAYRVQPTPGRTISLTQAVNTLIDNFTAVRDGIGAGNLPDGSAAAPALRFGADTDTGLFRSGTNMLGFAVAGVESLTLTASGLLGIGTANPQATLDVVGTANIRGNLHVAAGGVDNHVFIASSSNWGYYLRSVGDTFAILDTTNALRLMIDYPAGNVRPGSDNTQALGVASYRWSTLYLGSNPIVTSDGREKTDIRPLTAAELRAGKRIAGSIGIFQKLDAIALKGEECAREHAGVIAQAVWAIMADEGLIEPIADGVRPDSRYAFLCYDEWDAVEAVDEVRDEEGNVVSPASPARPAGNRFGVRTDQLALFLIAAQETRLAALEAAA